LKGRGVPPRRTPHMSQIGSRALQLAEKLRRRSGLYQGTSLLVPQKPQNQRRALRAAEKLSWPRCLERARL